MNFRDLNINVDVFKKYWAEFIEENDLDDFGSFDEAKQVFLSRYFDKLVGTSLDDIEDDEYDDFEDDEYDTEYDVMLMIQSLEHEADRGNYALENYIAKNKDVMKLKRPDLHEQLKVNEALGLGYLSQGFYYKAIETFNFVLRANPSDTFSVKYHMANAYLHIDYVDKENVCFNNYKKDERLLMILLIDSLNKSKKEEAQYYFEKIKALNKKLVPTIKKSKLPIDLVEKDPKGERSDEDRLIHAFRLVDEYVLMKYHYDYLKYFATNTLSADEFRVIEKRLSISEVNMKENPIFKNLANQVYLFKKAELYDAEEFSRVTEAEVLKLKGIGKKAIETLKQNGVKFKK